MTNQTRSPGEYMKHAARRGGRLRRLGIGLAVPVLLISYVVNVGPVSVLARKYPALMPAATIIYSPLFWLHDNTPLSGPLDEYYHFWNKYYHFWNKHIP